MSHKKVKFAFVFLLFVHMTVSVVSGAKPPRVLIFSGSNNHNWQKTTPAIQEILAESGISSDVTEEPDKCTAEMLSGYDVIVSNYNTLGAKDADWTETTKKAFLDFIRKGNGHVTVHAGGSSFGDWPQYQRIAAWRSPTTGYGPQHAFPINIVEFDHPICSGIYSFRTKDELWHNMAFPAGAQTLATAFSSKEFGGSGKPEPILAVSEFGKGRCVNLALGHDVTAMKMGAFRTLLTRSVQWASSTRTSTSLSDDVLDSRTSKAPKNLALGALADSPDGLEKDGKSQGDQAAIDGDDSTYWDERNKQSLYRLRIKLPHAETVGAIQITGYDHHNFAPKDFAVELDGKTVKNVTDAQYNDNNLLVLLDETKCTTVELKITGYYGLSPAIRELAIFGPTQLDTLDTIEFTEASDIPDLLEWKETDTSIALTNNDKIVWRFNYSVSEPKPYFHPLSLMDGTILTWNNPPDHIWHHALWFSWKYINGINYWEPNDREKGTYAGVTEWGNVDIEQYDDHSASINMDLQYHPAGESNVMTERRTVLISAPDSAGQYTIAWTSTFTAVEKIILDRTPITGQKDGVSWGGYAGLSLRIAMVRRQR